MGNKSTAANRSVGKCTHAEIDQDVSGIVQYLLEKKGLDSALAQSFHDRASMAVELDSILEDLDRATSRANALYTHFQLGSLYPFNRVEKIVIECREAVMTARTLAWIAKHEFLLLHPQRTKAMDLQRSAVRLAVAYFDHLGRGKARKYSKIIMQKANLVEPEESSITRWIKEFREDEDKPTQADIRHEM